MLGVSSTDGYTAGAMQQAISQMLVPRRIHLMAKKPLLAVEVVAPLARIEPVSAEEEAEFKAWYDWSSL